MRLKVAFQQCAVRRLISHSRLKRPFNLIYEQRLRVKLRLVIGNFITIFPLEAIHSSSGDFNQTNNKFLQYINSILWK